MLKLKRKIAFEVVLADDKRCGCRNGHKTVSATQDAQENRWTNPLVPCAGHKLRPVETIVGTSTLTVWSCGTSGMAASPKSKYSAISDWILELSMVMAG